MLETGPNQTEWIGGVLVGDEVKFGIPIPDLDSILVGFSADTVVTGLDQIPDDEEPPAPTLLHLAFDAMVGIASALLLLSAIYGWVWWRKRRLPESKWFWRAASVSGIACIVALECGWIVTEVGRQPWVVHGLLRTEDAVTQQGGLWLSLTVVVLIYAALGAGTIWALRAMSRRWRERGRGRDRPALRPSRPGGGNRRVTELTIVIVVLWAAVVLYAVFGGADFGAGLWDLLAGGAERGERPRAFIDRVLTPVWEANHVWLIFILVVTWTAFPRGFAAITSVLYVPLFLAAIGIVLRGAGFAFRHIVRGLPGRRALGATFALSSVVTPFFMGCVAGVIATRGILEGDAVDRVGSWLSPSSIGIGALLVAACGYLAAVFLVEEARKVGDSEMQSYFRRRALAAAVVAGALAILDLFLLADDAPDLLGRSLLLVIASALLGLVAIVQLLRDGPARLPAVGAVACVVCRMGRGPGRVPAAGLADLCRRRRPARHAGHPACCVRRRAGLGRPRAGADALAPAARPARAGRRALIRL